MNESIETVVVGGGQAGLAISYMLTQAGQEHLVLERGQVAERWRSERWDSLTLLTPSWMTRVPGYQYAGPAPDGFMARAEVVHLFENYAASFGTPIRTATAVTALRVKDGSPRYLVVTADSTLEAKNVVIATGPFQRPAVPAVAAELPADIYQVHSSRYRNPAQLPSGAVVVVGTGSSGPQIAEELHRDGRPVYLSVGRHRLRSRHYRGRDSFWWMQEMGSLDVTANNSPSPETGRGPRGAMLTGVDGGHDLSPRLLAAQGVQLVGHVRGVRNTTVSIAPDLAANLAAGDATLVAFRQSIDEYIRRAGIDAPTEDDRDGDSGPQGVAGAPIQELALRGRGITSVVWATGFRDDFGWVQLPIFDEAGEPVHRRGVTACRGVYFLGRSWLHTQKSSFIYGMNEDATYLAEQLTSRAP